VKRESGQSAIEFALILLPFLFVFFFIVDGGLLFARYVAVTNEVRERARCAVVGGTLDNQPNHVLAPIVDENPTHSFDPDPPAVGDAITIEVEWTYDFITPLGALGLPDSITRTSEATMRLETTTFTRECAN
jgi:hypothetical protein